MPETTSSLLETTNKNESKGSAMVNHHANTNRQNVNNEVYFDLENLPFQPDFNYFPYTKGQLSIRGNSQSGGLSDYIKNHYTSNISNYWNTFFKHNTNKFFKNRNWFLKEYELLKDAIKNNLTFNFCEIGVGCGNTINGLLNNINTINENYNIENNLTLYGFDCSKVAIDILKEQYAKFKNIHLFVHDLLSNEEVIPGIPMNSINLSSMIFVLSAFPNLDMMKRILNTKVANLLAKDGVLFLRDYAINDLAYERYLKEEMTKKINDKAFVRGDGTFVYFFDENEIISLFDDKLFKVLECKVVTKVVKNRKEGDEMNRKFIQIIVKRI
ncbi:hypothetical protein ABK040_010020 [Willaertia magna]